MSALETHRAAAVWPMLPEPDLRRLADDIAENGLRHPIVLDAEGRVLDGRNRLAACRIAGVEPDFETYDGDAVAYVLSANNERRHLSLPERAAATALTLATNGHRKNERWTYGKVAETSPDSKDSKNWTTYMAMSGVVLDHVPGLLQNVADGHDSLDSIYRYALQIRDEKARRTELPDDLGVLVDAGELSLDLALRRAKLPERYARLVASGDLDLDEAEHLANRDDREHREAIQRYVSGLTSFLYGWNTAVNLADDPNRTDVLEALDDQERVRFLEIEQSLKEIA
jgi:hypothetical protein